MESKYESLFADWHSEKSVDIGLVSPIEPEREGRASSQSSQTLLEKRFLIEEGVPRQRFNIRKLYRKPDRIFERVSSTFSGHFAHGKSGWWKKQMLVDRGLRSMAAFVLVCAVIMFIIIFSYLKDFVHRINKRTTSVGGKTVESCTVLEGRSLVRTCSYVHHRYSPSA
jgi:hypothetical protein